jgi:hypothetical protein
VNESKYLPKNTGKKGKKCSRKPVKNASKYYNKFWQSIR